MKYSAPLALCNGETGDFFILPLFPLFCYHYSHMPEQTQAVMADQRPARIEEPILKNNKSTLRRGCSWTLGCAFILLLVSILLGWFFSAPSPQRSALLPTGFPTDIPLYKFEDRSTITYLIGARKDSSPQRLALVPRFFFNQILKIITPEAGSEVKNLNGPIAISWQNPWRDVKNIMRTPAADNNLETVALTWENLLDEQKETIFDFYKKNLKSQEYRIIPGLKTAYTLTMDFTKEKTRGGLRVENAPGGGVNVTLEVEYQKK